MLQIGLLLGLGVMALTSVVKLLLPIPVEAWVKLAAALVLSGVSAVFYSSSAHEWVLLASLIVGTSMFAHVLHKLISALGDAKRMDTIVRSTPRNLRR